MLDHARGALLRTGTVWPWTVPVLFGDTATGMRAFPKKDYSTAYRNGGREPRPGRSSAESFSRHSESSAPIIVCQR